MKNKLFVLFILFGGFTIFLGIKFFILNKTNETGILRVNSSPVANIFLNNLIVGKTPYENNQKPGEYILKLIPEKTSTDTASWNGKIKIYKKSKTYVNFDLGSSDIFTSGEIFTVEKISPQPKNLNYGEIYVETEPQGAIVTLDNDDKGTAPLILKDVLKGDHELSVFMPGFFRRSQRINVSGGYRINAYFKLGLDQSQKQFSDLEKQSTLSAKTEKKIMIVIKDNPQGWLRVRSDASINATEEARVKTGEKFEFLEEKNGWYKIKFNGRKEALVSGEFAEGWVSKDYVLKEE